LNPGVRQLSENSSKLQMNSRVMTLKENFEEQQPESDRKLFSLLFLFGHINTLLNNPARANGLFLMLSSILMRSMKLNCQS